MYVRHLGFLSPLTQCQAMTEIFLTLLYSCMLNILRFAVTLSEPPSLMHTSSTVLTGQLRCLHSLLKSFILIAYFIHTITHRQLPPSLIQPPISLLRHPSTTAPRSHIYILSFTARLLCAGALPFWSLPVISLVPLVSGFPLRSGWLAPKGLYSVVFQVFSSFTTIARYCAPSTLAFINDVV